MSIAAPSRQMTAEEFLRWSDNGGKELIHGQIVELPEMGARSLYISQVISYLLMTWARSGNRGWVFPNDSGIQCFPDDPQRIRKPDVCFVRAGRFAGDDVPEGWITLPPDLTVEVVSPNDVWSEVSEKVTDYLDAGIPLVWVVDPTRDEVHVHRLHGKPEILTADDELRDETVLPGFSCQVSEFFATRL
jgi:Uma2 family endonuclease